VELVVVVVAAGHTRIYIIMSIYIYHHHSSYIWFDPYLNSHVRKVLPLLQLVPEADVVEAEEMGQSEAAEGERRPSCIAETQAKETTRALGGT
jgi:hypothetical protein